MNSLEIGKAIAVQRRHLGLTQQALAERAKVSRRSLIAVEAGEADIGLRRLQRILQALGMTLAIEVDVGRPTESELRTLFRDDDE